MSEYERLSLALLGQIASSIQTLTEMIDDHVSDEAKESLREIRLRQGKTLAGFMEEVSEAIKT